MLLELAIGDAYGAGFEYVPREVVATENTVQRYRRHQKHEIDAGYYTDDTQMSLAIAEAVVSGDEWTPEMLAERFVDVFKRDPRTGYAHGFYRFLTQVRDGAEFLALIKPLSDKSGAAMRAAPAGVFPSVAEVIEKTTIQARLTHDTPDGIAAARAAALMTHYFLYEHGPKEDLGIWLEERVPGFPWAEPWEYKVGSKGWMSVRAAVTAVMANDSLTRLLRSCVAFSGDVDTVATVALAAASCSPEYVSDLPSSLVWGLESGTYGRDYLLELDEKLMACVQPKKEATP